MVGQQILTLPIKVRILYCLLYLRSLMERPRSSKPVYAGSSPVGDALNFYILKDNRRKYEKTARFGRLKTNFPFLCLLMP